MQDAADDHSNADNEPGLRSAASLSDALAAGTFSSEELLAHFLARCKRLNPALNAVIATNIEDALEQARASDARRQRGQSLGPLDGLPMTVKDAFQVVGMPTTSGAMELKDFRPEENAVVVQRLIDAGVVIYGKSNSPLYTTGYETYNEIFGTTNNPWDLARTPGGSSGGSAVSTAVGLTSFEIGSDLGGSIRVPASFCGVFGHKPSFGITQMRGHIPGPPGTMAELDMCVAGPLARSAHDLTMALEVMARPDRLDAKGWRLDLPAPRHQRLEDFRIAVWLDDPVTDTEEAVRAQLETAVRALERAGATVTKAKPDNDMNALFATFLDLVSAIFGGGLAPQERAALAEVNSAADPTDDGVNARWQRGALQSHADWLATNETRIRLRYAWSRFFANYDVLLTPPMCIPAFAHNQQDRGGDFISAVVDIKGRPRPYLELAFWPCLANLLYLPATVAPTGLSKTGLPVGLQIMGDFLDDRTTLRFAELSEPILGGFRPPPDI